MDTSPHTSDFVSVTDPHSQSVRLHYLDWGGSGPVLLFIPGMGCTAHIFDRFAPRFCDQFHVLALTRRGNGESDIPETGYDADTLADDLRQFLDALHIDQVILAGHSMGYIELSRFTQLYPERVLKLIWIDAAYDRTSPEDQAMLARNPAAKMMPPWPSEALTSIEDYAATVQRLYPSLAAIWGPELEADLRANVTLTPGGQVVEKMTDAISSALSATMKTYFPDYASIRTPMLSIFVLHAGADFLSPDFMSVDQRAQVINYFNNDRHPHIRNYIEQFRCSLPHARVVVIPDGHHYCFIKQADQVFHEIRSFLLNE
jgi:pimeloyl-ACP methyl ester carboxylesterase